MMKQEILNNNANGNNGTEHQASFTFDIEERSYGQDKKELLTFPLLLGKYGLMQLPEAVPCGCMIRMQHYLDTWATEFEKSKARKLMNCLQFTNTIKIRNNYET